MKRLLIMGCVTAVAVGALAPGIAGAAAAPKPKGKTACTTAVGTATGTIVIGGCVDVNGADTGGGTAALSTTALAFGGTVAWNSGKTTVFTAPLVLPTKATKCPGYVRFKRNTTPPPEPTAFKFSGTVTADTSGMKVPGKIKGAVCVGLAGDISVLKTIKVS